MNNDTIKYTSRPGKLKDLNAGRNGEPTNIRTIEPKNDEVQIWNFRSVLLHSPFDCSNVRRFAVVFRKEPIFSIDLIMRRAYHTPP
jgi:hypothetical protein